MKMVFLKLTESFFFQTLFLPVRSSASSRTNIYRFLQLFSRNYETIGVFIG